MTDQNDSKKLASDAEQIVSDVAVATSVITKANTWTALIGFFTALPGLVVLLQNFMTWLNRVSGNNPGALIADMGEAWSKLNSAKNQEDRQNAAKAIAAIIHRIP